jgi:hypothetical protein
MSGNLGPIDIQCDAPPYPVVKACVSLGFHEPEDVRWCRIERRRLRRPSSLFPWLRAAIPMCVCGQPLPKLESYTFTFVSGSQLEYHLGQCSRCRTIYWDKD